MPRPKRADRLGGNGTGQHQPVQETPVTEGTLFRRIICPVCGVNHGYISRIHGTLAETGPGIQRDNYWNFDRDPTMHYGQIMSSAGRGTLRKVGEFGPDDDPDGFYDKVKFHLLSALQEWHERGWITEKEIRNATGGKDA